MFSDAVTEGTSGSQVRFNNATQQSATLIWVSHETTDGKDVTTFFDITEPASALYIQEFDDATRYIMFTQTQAPVNKGTYHEFAVAFDRMGLDLQEQKILFAILR